MSINPSDRLVVESSMAGFFQGLVSDAVENQQADISEEATCYVVNLLAAFAHSDKLFENTQEGLMIQPLALLYGEALEAPNAEKRNHALRRLGDVALFICGIFSDSLNRKVVDVDYYITMGGSAYGSISSAGRQLARWRALGAVFDELGAKFASLVDVLHEVGDQTRLRNDSDIMRLYEIWQRTGSRYAERQLGRFGIHPVDGVNNSLKH
jgi:hypothetical protein